MADGLTPPREIGLAPLRRPDADRRGCALLRFGTTGEARAAAHSLHSDRGGSGTRRRGQMTEHRPYSTIRRNDVSPS
eukprot:7376699-Prymnesium_polylepis.1